MQPARTNRSIAIPRTWNEIPQGAWIAQQFKLFIANQCPKMFGYHLIKIGSLSAKLNNVYSPIRHHAAVCEQVEYADISGSAQELPLKTACIDLCILAHTLDFSPDPHQVLREVDRVLTADGWAIFCGFNAVSLANLGRILPWRRDKTLRAAQMFVPDRITDWLKLLGFEILAQDFCGFSFFKKNSKVGGWREDILSKYCKKFGSVYMISARKRTTPLTPSRVTWRMKRRRITETGVAKIRSYRTISPMIQAIKPRSSSSAS